MSVRVSAVGGDYYEIVGQPFQHFADIANVRAVVAVGSDECATRSQQPFGGFDFARFGFLVRVH
jgi:hypothetical protein